MRRLLLPLLLAGIAACGGSDAGLGPDASKSAARVTIDRDVVTLAVGAAVQLSAAVHGANGTAIVGRTVSWRSTSPDKAAVSAAGLVTGVAPGSATVVAAAEGREDSVAVTVVRAATVATCGGGTTSLRVGEVRTLAGAERDALCLDGGQAGAEYSLIPFFGSQSAAATLSLDVAGEGITGVQDAAAQRAVAGGLSFSRAAFDAADGEAVEARIREQERRQLSGLIAGARAGAARGLGPSLSVAGAGPQVGARMVLNAQGNHACTNPSPRVARVAAVTQHAVVVADSANPSGGFTDEEYREIGATFDAHVHPLVTQTFGAPGDLDRNGGRVIIYFTRAVNELTPAGAQSVIGGFFHARDLFPKAGQGACAGSNEAEMFYMLVPDPRGEVNGNVRTKASVQQRTVGVLAHEYQHLVNASRRLYVNNAPAWEDAWLNEGLSHIAEELMFYRAAGLSPRGNLDIARLRSSQAILNAVNTYQISNFGRLAEYLKSPETRSPYADDDELATRGAAWQFLRYVADRLAQPEQSLWFALANSRSAGIANVAAVTGTEVVSLARDWTTAQITDDAGFSVAAPYQHPSWSFRSVMAELNGGAFPLRTRSLAAGAPARLTLNGGGAAYLHFAVPAGSVGSVRATSQGAGVPASVSLTLVRTR